jgi:cytoskeleton protein RodZ
MTEPSQEPAGAGALLRAAREKQGLHIAALAAAIKVSPRKLDALENDRWAELPDATFVRALAQTVCRTLKVDPKPVLDKLPAAPPVVLETQDAGLNTPFRDRPGRVEPGLAQSAVKPMILGAALLMVAAVLVYLLPADLLQRRPSTAGAASAAAAAAAVPAASVPAGGSAQEAVAASAPASASLAMAPAFMPDAASAPAAGEPVFVAPPPVGPATTAPLSPVVPAATAPAAPAAAQAAGVVQVRTTQSSWVEVRDGRGNTLLSRIVVAGESVGLDGPLPIRLTIGNAAATQVAFRGQQVDLAARTRDNVARVELQ